MEFVDFQKPKTYGAEHRENWGEKLGEGTFGRVFSLTGYNAVVKEVYRQDSFEDELTCYEAVGNRPHVCQLLGFSPARRLLVLEQLSPLKIADIAKLDLHQRVTLLLGVTRGVGWLHEAKFAHLDLKIGNLAIHRDGSVKVIDLGGAKRFGELLNYASGTPGHRPKEQAKPSHLSAVKPAFDLFAIGTVIASVLSAPRRLEFKDFNHIGVLKNLSNVSLKKQDPTTFGLLYDIAEECLTRPEGISTEVLAQRLANLLSPRYTLRQRLCGFKSTGFYNTCYANAMTVFLAALLKEEVLEKQEYKFKSLIDASRHLQNIANANECFDTGRVLAELMEFGKTYDSSPASKFSDYSWNEQSDVIEVVHTVIESAFRDRYIYMWVHRQ